MIIGRKPSGGKDRSRAWKSGLSLPRTPWGIKAPSGRRHGPWRSAARRSARWRSSGVRPADRLGEPGVVEPLRLGGHAPGGRLDEVLRHAAAAGVETGDAVLRHRVAAAGGVARSSARRGPRPSHASPLNSRIENSTSPATSPLSAARRNHCAALAVSFSTPRPGVETPSACWAGATSGGRPAAAAPPPAQILPARRCRAGSARWLKLAVGVGEPRPPSRARRARPPGSSPARPSIAIMRGSPSPGHRRDWRRAAGTALPPPWRGPAARRGPGCTAREQRHRGGVGPVGLQALVASRKAVGRSSRADRRRRRGRPSGRWACRRPARVAPGSILGGPDGAAAAAGRGRRAGARGPGPARGCTRLMRGSRTAGNDSRRRGATSRTRRFSGAEGSGRSGTARRSTPRSRASSGSQRAARRRRPGHTTTMPPRVFST